MNTIFDEPLTLADRGYVVVDLYAGCIIYDFDASNTYVFDLDEYRTGPFILDANRLPGSRRFMTLEEWNKGAVIDQATNVFTLGRTVAEFLGRGATSVDAWLGTDPMGLVTPKATSGNRSARHQSVQEFVEDWQSVD
ncbi:MAG: hypothetical protein LR120_06120 [Dehalococcoidia bacterium]|nr:hypothetical protein [Dehalococcoidia bacterium]